MYACFELAEKLRAGLSPFTFHWVPGGTPLSSHNEVAFSCGLYTGEGYPPFSLVCSLLLLFGSVFSGSRGGFLSPQPGDPFGVSGFPSLGLVRS